MIERWGMSGVSGGGMSERRMSERLREIGRGVSKRSCTSTLYLVVAASLVALAVLTALL